MCCQEDREWDFLVSDGGEIQYVEGGRVGEEWMVFRG
jgi:hypothetical protein